MIYSYIAPCQPPPCRQGIESKSRIQSSYPETNHLLLSQDDEDCTEKKKAEDDGCQKKIDSKLGAHHTLRLAPLLTVGLTGLAVKTDLTTVRNF